MPKRVYQWLAALLICRAMFAAEIHVSAAASLTDALKEIARNYPQKIIFNFGASSVLARQIQEGARADLFFSADEEKMDWLELAGLIEAGTRTNLLSNSLVIVVAKESALEIRSPDVLTSLRRIALAEPKTVPAGIYARQYLERQKLWPGLKASVIATENVRGALAAVEGGNVDAAIVYKTDAAASGKVRVAFEIPAFETPGIVYPAAIIKDSKNKKGAGDFLEFSQSPTARAVFEKFGFLAPKESATAP